MLHSFDYRKNQMINDNVEFVIGAGVYGYDKARKMYYYQVDDITTYFDETMSEYELMKSAIEFAYCY